MNLRNNILVLLLILYAFSLTQRLLASPIILKEVYQIDYEMINRTVLTFNERTTYRIDPQRNEQRILIYIDNASKNELVPNNQNFVSPVLESIRITEGTNDLLITITTKQRYYHRSFDIATNEYKLVLDIYNKQNPENDSEKFIFAKFYYATSNFRRAENLFRDVLASSPEITGANYYIGELMLNRSNREAAIDRFSQVSYLADEYLRAQAQLFNLGIIRTEFSDEIDETFSEYRDNFLRAEDLNRQKLLLAISSSPFGEIDQTKRLLSQLDYNDPELTMMINNMQLLYQNLQQDKELQKSILFHSTSNVSSQPLFIPWYFIVLITVIITVIITIPINNSIWKERLRRLKRSERITGSPPIEKQQEEDTLVEEELNDLEDTIGQEEEQLTQEEKTGLKVAPGFEKEFKNLSRSLLYQEPENEEKEEVIEEEQVIEQEPPNEIDTDLEKNPFKDQESSQYEFPPTVEESYVEEEPKQEAVLQDEESLEEEPTREYEPEIEEKAYSEPETNEEERYSLDEKQEPVEEPQQEESISDQQPIGEEPEMSEQPPEEAIMEIPDELKKVTEDIAEPVVPTDVITAVEEQKTEEEEEETPSITQPDLEPSNVIFEDLKLKLVVQLFRLGWSVEAIAEEMGSEAYEIKRILEQENR